MSFCLPCLILNINRWKWQTNSKKNPKKTLKERRQSKIRVSSSHWKANEQTHEIGLPILSIFSHPHLLFSGQQRPNQKAFVACCCFFFLPWLLQLCCLYSTVNAFAPATLFVFKVLHLVSSLWLYKASLEIWRSEMLVMNKLSGMCLMERKAKYIKIQPLALAWISIPASLWQTSSQMVATLAWEDLRGSWDAFLFASSNHSGKTASLHRQGEPTFQQLFIYSSLPQSPIVQSRGKQLFQILTK